MRKKSEMPQPIVEAHEHDTVFRELTAVVNSRRAAAVHEAAPVDPEHHRQFRAARLRRAPHGDVETVFSRAHPERCGIAWKRILHAVRTKGLGLAHTGPVL